MQLSVDVDAGVVLAKLQKLARERVSVRRREIVLEGSRTALRETIQRTPVDEGEARSSWVAGLRLLGGGEVSGWEGPQARSESILEGSRAMRVERLDGSVQTEIACRNEVEHVVYLEYGTRRMSPRASVQRSLETTAEFMRRVEFLTAGMMQ